MPEYNYLNQNESNFPHIGSVNVFKYDNEFDYSRFDYTQMILQICAVPWDMGEAHIGNRTISGIGNVVYFGSKEERDSWFDKIPDSECYRFTTKFKELHRSLQIDVPIPYDVAAQYNYLRVEYARAANENSPVEYEEPGGLNEWFWFIREVEFLAPNTTRLILMPDAFQTWIYDVNISGMLLERGHAPMFATPTDAYLQNPIENNEYLLTEDVNFGDSMQTKHIDTQILNSGNMYACIASTATPLGYYGSKSGNDWKVPAIEAYTQDGIPSVYVFGMKAERLNTFLKNIDSSYPQFKQTIQAVFFASDKILDIGSSFTFANTTCYFLTSSRKTLPLLELRKENFGYPVRYENMAKLYTYPYAQINITDENGNTDTIRIEDTNGKIDVSAAISLSYPFLNISTHLLGVGGNTLNVVTYKNIDSKTFAFGGNWYEYLHDWQIPTFAVVLDPSIENDYATYFDRRQARTDYYAAWDNAYDIANTQVANAGIQTAGNSANNSANVAYASARASEDNDVVSRQTNAALTQLTSTTNNQVAATDAQASIAAVSTGISAGASAISSAVSGDYGGAIGSLVGGGVEIASTFAQAAVANDLTTSNANASGTYTITTGNSAQAANSYNASLKNTNSTSITSNVNAVTNGTAANSAATTKGNADRTANAAQSAIDNGIKQAGLNAPSMFGDFANGDSASTKPMGLFAQIQTQSKAAISSAGDEFARYGYTFDKQWQFDGNWNIGKYFTYWKLRDFWVSNLNVPDMYMDRLRFFLFGGVTVWRKPEYIGNINIYDNF